MNFINRKLFNFSLKIWVLNTNPNIKDALVTLVSRKTSIQNRAKIFTQTFLLETRALFQKNIKFSFLLNTQKSWKISSYFQIWP